MAIPKQDTNPWYRLIMKIKGPDKSWSEHFLMKNTGFDVVTADAKCVCLWRAATLATDLRLDYAVVTQSGPARTSRCAIDNPVRGGSGVKFDETLVTPPMTRMNTSGDGLELRFETLNNRHGNRMLKGVPDSWINSEKYSPEAVLPPRDKIDFGNYSAAMDNTEIPETQDVYIFGKTPAYTPTQRAKFVEYEEALQRFFKAVYNFTTSEYDNLDGSGNPTGTVTVDPWRKFIYRYAGSRSIGDPF